MIQQLSFHQDNLEMMWFSEPLNIPSTSTEMYTKLTLHSSLLVK